MDKKAWLKIVEAVVAILLISGVIIIVINRGQVEKKDISTRVYEAEIAILREIQLNDTLREDVLGATPPIEWENIPERVKNKIIERTPNYLECEAKICAPDDSCYLDNYPDEETYAQSVIISVNTDSSTYNPRQLKLFCWTK